MRVFASIFLLATALAPASVVAQTLQKSEDIVEFFATEAGLGATRGICVGTEDQCRSKTDAPAKTGLDMLVNFDLDSAALTPDAQAKLDEFAKALKDSRLNKLSFVVEGHTDASGPDRYNENLSKRRAESVTAFLLQQGIESQRIEAIGLGKAKPRDPDPYAAVNRRVEMRLNATQ